MNDNTSVRVAVRVRPLVVSEISRGCREIVEVIDENNQILIKSLDKDRAYSFDYVLSTKAHQEQIYERCVKELVANLFKGYNVTILAYGQTGSGKTHTMGTTYTGVGDMGVIPRAVTEIFAFTHDNFSFDFSVSVSFMELYQENLYDLLSNKQRDQCALEIREDAAKGILIPNLTEIEVNSVKEVLEILEKGTAGRATSATAMNAQSSRSHAIFTVNISMNHKENCAENKQAKLHLVDLAGSERPKKTQATGNTFKEGVTINRGLLALGNVISCLGDEKSQHGFVPYRDSNLTRLLKDSLGGNSITLMIACVSPADYNLEETISTLRYADRAKKIKNKPIINQDPKAAEINALKKTIQHLRLQILGQGGPVVSPAEMEDLKKEVVELKNRKREISLQLSSALMNNTCLHEKIIILQNSNESLNTKFTELKQRFETTFKNIVVAMESEDTHLLKEHVNELEEIQNQINEIKNDQKNAEDEINAHDSIKHRLKDSVDNEKGESVDVEEQQEFHADRQFKLNIQLSEIERELNLKENLAKQLIDNNQYFVDPQAMAENESKISQLEREKEELLQMLKNVGNSGKIAEARRKRVQELEQQLTELKKKVQEQNHIIKLKAKAEERIKLLNQEIIQMKQAKVKLVKTMREESDKFRQWKLEKERECIRLKRQDIKKEHEINKMKVMHNKQQNVFKRRVEEAEAINKRLKQALALKKQAQDSRNSGKAEKLEPWLKQEFDLYVNLVEADATLKFLLEDRATLQAQLDEMRSNCGDGDNTSECKSIEDDLELRSVQIQDLQQKLLDSDEDARSKFRFDKFQTMAEAKYGLKFLFAKTADAVKEKVNFHMKLSEIQELHKETVEKLKETKKNHMEEVSKLQQENEQHIALLVAQIKSKMDDSIEKDRLIARTEQLEKDNVALKSQIRTIVETASKVEKTPARHPQEIICIGDTPSSPTIKVVPLMDRNEIPQNDILARTPKCDSLDEIDLDDLENDPDWRKTPLGKRILEEKKKITRTALSFADDKPVKRSSDGGCTCKTNCRGPRCGCKKIGKTCTDLCKCKDGCQNREGSSMEEPFTESNEDFKKPSDKDEVPRKKKKTRNLFSLKE